MGGLLGGEVEEGGWACEWGVGRGAGACICGEETSLFSSIEGLRGEPRDKPPFPTQEGLFGLPTVVNNVETLVGAVAITMDKDGNSKLFPISGAINNPGFYEALLGVSVAAPIDAAGGPTPDVQAVLVGSPPARSGFHTILKSPSTTERNRRLVPAPSSSSIPQPTWQ